MENAADKKFATSNLQSAKRDGDDGFCCCNHPEDKKLRLFGFVVDPYDKGGICPSSEGEESVNFSETVFSRTEETVKEKSSLHLLEPKKYECQFCLKKFASSRALGGHQKAHKKERLQHKKMQFQARRARFNFYLQPLLSNSGFIYHHSPLWF